MKAKLTFLLALGFSLAVSAGPLNANEAQAPAEELTEKVRMFLQKEMDKLAQGGRLIEHALAEGDNKTVAKEAAKMHETFVHHDEITTFDLRVLETVLGEDFVARDKDFHKYARALEAAARAGDKEKQNMLFQSMLERCATCHAAYAPEAPVLELPE